MRRFDTPFDTRASRTRLLAGSVMRYAVSEHDAAPFQIQIFATAIPSNFALSINAWSRQRIACAFRLSAMASIN